MPFVENSTRGSLVVALRWRELCVGARRRRCGEITRPLKLVRGLRAATCRVAEFLCWLTEEVWLEMMELPDTLWWG